MNEITINYWEAAIRFRCFSKLITEYIINYFIDYFSFSKGIADYTIEVYSLNQFCKIGKKFDYVSEELWCKADYKKKNSNFSITRK